MVAATAIESLLLRPFPLSQLPAAEATLAARLKGLFWMGPAAVSRRWDVATPLGSGASGPAFQVVDRKNGKRHVLKVYRAGLVSEQVLEGGLRPCEGEILAKIRHVGVVQAVEHGVTESGQYYVITEFLEGPSLARMPATWTGDRLQLVRRVAEGVQAVHEAGYAHCDICPANLILTPGDQPKLFDFGMAHALHAHVGRNAVHISRTEFLPPELIRAQTIEPTLDVFQLGVTAYALIAGVLPFEPQVSGTSVARAIRRPENIRKVMPDIDPLLAHAIHRAMGPDPTKRFATVQEFLQALSRATLLRKSPETASESQGASKQ